MEEIKRALELDPLSLAINTAVGWLFYIAGKYDQAIEQYRKTLEMDPSFVDAWMRLSVAFEMKGMHTEAIEAHLKARTLSGDNLEEIATLREAYAKSGWKGYWQKMLEQLREQSKRRYVSPLRIALSYTRLGEKDQALEWLEKAYEEHAGGWNDLKVAPLFDSLRSEPRFKKLLRKMGLEK